VNAFHCFFRYPWGEEAFKEARRRNKPIFLSVGYSTCHWCHVMERESFESESIAQVMNDNFVNIKMDREERPDIDRVYMTFVQAVSGSGGWPMSVWLTADLKPIYAGTYYPPDDRYYGRPGFRALLQTISDQWEDDCEKFILSADSILEVIKKSAILPVGKAVPDAKAVSGRCVQQLTRSYEPTFGGFSQQPKFPQPSNVVFLLHHLATTSDTKSKDDVAKMVDHTLKSMAIGGIHDHVGMVRK